MSPASQPGSRAPRHRRGRSQVLWRRRVRPWLPRGGSGSGPQSRSSWSSGSQSRRARDAEGPSRVVSISADDQGGQGRAVELQAELASCGQHRALSLGDALAAAVAERLDLVVPHYDADCDRAGAATGQPHQWAVPRDLPTNDPERRPGRHPPRVNEIGNAGAPEPPLPRRLSPIRVSTAGPPIPLPARRLPVPPAHPSSTPGRRDLAASKTPTLHTRSQGGQRLPNLPGYRPVR